jgi:hypothetical protein
MGAGIINKDPLWGSVDFKKKKKKSSMHKVQSRVLQRSTRVQCRTAKISLQAMEISFRRQGP